MMGEVETVTVKLDRRAYADIASNVILTPQEQERAGRFRFNQDRLRFMAVRIILRHLLGERLNILPALVKLVYGVHGKPKLVNQFLKPHLYFNLSYTDEIAVFAFAHSHEVGIDIEAVRTLPEAPLIAARMFSPCEYEMYLMLPQAEKELGFFNCWTRKEAFIKAIGLGLNYPLHSFDVSLAPGDSPRVLEIRNPVEAKRSWSMESFSPTPCHVACLVAVKD